MSRRILLVFFISGLAGLIYQVTWVRVFGQIFGNTMQSAALVTGVFIMGLGVGSFLAGRIVDRRNSTRPTIGLEYYAYAELLIGFLGIVTTLLIPHIESLSPLISSYRVGEQGWQQLTLSSYLWRYLIAVVFIGPMTILMGATLTLLIRYLLAHSVHEAGWKTGLLYGVNTLGAAMGCVFVDLVSVKTIGLSSTMFLAAMCNFVAGAAAWQILKSAKLVKVQNQAAAPDSTADAAAQVRVWPAGLSIFISGFCAMGMEIVWFRFLTSVLGPERFIFSLLLTVLLAGMWLGAMLGGYLVRRFRSAGAFYVISQLLFAAAVIGCFFLFISTERIYFAEALYGRDATDPLLWQVLKYLTILVPELKTVFLPGILMGAAYPLLCDLVQTSTGGVGQTAGKIYLWNSLGALAGSLSAGFILLPTLGMKQTTTLLACGAIVAVGPVLFYYQPFAGSSKRYLRFSVVGVVLALVLGGAWILNPELYLVKNSFLKNPFGEGEHLLTIKEGMTETVVVSETNNPSAGSYRTLFTNGHSMSATSYNSQRYMRSFAHIPLLQIENPESVLVICFGVGNTLHAASLHPSVRRLDVVDLSKNVLRHASYFSQTNGNVLTDPRTQVFVNDGRQHLRMQPEGTYDLITLEPPPLKNAGVASLYSTEFYQLARRDLKPGGFVSQWLPIYQISGDDARALVKSFLDVFPNAVLLNGADHEFILLGQKDGLNQIDWRMVERNIQARPTVRDDLEKIDLRQPVEWLGLFAASSGWLKEKLSHVDAMVDNYPTIEYTDFILTTVLPKELFNTGSFKEWCPDCFVDGHLVPQLSPLANFLSIKQAVYTSNFFDSVGSSKTDKALSVPIVSAVEASELDMIPHPLTNAMIHETATAYPHIAKIFGIPLAPKPAVHGTSVR